MEWNFDIESAPSSDEVLVATKCKKRFISRRLENGRWLGLATKEQPVAWAALLDHPSGD